MPFRKVKTYLALKIASAYLVIGSLYIIFSDRLLEMSFSEETINRLQSQKGIAFVLLTSILIFFLIRQNLKTLNESERKYRLLANYSKDLICLHKPNADYIYLSPSVKDLLGYNLNELVGKNPYDYIHPDDHETIRKDSHERLYHGETVDVITYRIRKKSGEYIWFESVNTPILQNNELLGIVSSSREVTHKIKANEAIKIYQKSLQNLTSELLLIEEKQKKEIASNIHDHLSQALVISKMKLESLRNTMDSEKSVNEINAIINHLEEAINNSRKITYDLSPPVLYQLGLIDTMYWFAEKIEDKYNLKVNFKTNINEINLPDNKLIFIFRSIQEIVTNTVKHAKASFVNIEFQKSKSGIQITISDNGIGIDLNQFAKNQGVFSSENDSGFGLFSVKERIENLSGEMKIESEPEKGTKIIFFIPLD